MKSSVVSRCSSLELFPVASIINFARLGSRVCMLATVTPFGSGAVPGTVAVSSASEGGRIRKKISFERADVSPEGMQTLDWLKETELIARYVDARGNRRVSGSPNWPLSLDYSEEGDVCTVILEGEDTHPDAFLID